MHPHTPDGIATSTNLMSCISFFSNQVGIRRVSLSPRYLQHELCSARYVNQSFDNLDTCQIFAHPSAILDFPAVDTSFGGTSDAVLINGTEIAGTTTIRFARKLNTGDRYDTVIGSSGLYLVWAYGTTDGSGTTYAKHASTGSGMVYFLSQPGNATPVNLTGQIIAGNSSSLSAIVATTPQMTSTTKNFKVWWSINSSTGVFTMTMQGNTTGWISVGFSDTPFMTDVDMVVSLSVRNIS